MIKETWESISATTGNNLISITSASSGQNTVITGAGNDSILVQDIKEIDDTRSSNYINAGDGKNYIYNSKVKESTIIAGTDNDTIITGGGDYWNNSINDAGAGDNRITVNTAMTNGQIYAGDGNDLVSIADDSDNNLISLGGGNNTVNSANGREDVYTGSGDDKITVAGGYINVGDGNNEVSITAGGDTSIIAGADDDSIYVADLDKTAEQRYYHSIDAGDGNNYIYNSNVEYSTINAGSGNDTIITGGGYYYNKNIINAGAGDNRITVNTAMTNGQIYAEGGNDLVSIADDSHNNIISLGAGNNTVYSASGGESVYTGDDDDYVLINNSNNENIISVGGGNNTVNSASGREDVYTGSGDDKITVAGGYVDGDEGKNEIFITAGGDTSIIAGADDDSIYVADLDKTTEQRYYHSIDAGDGNNYIYNSNVEHSTIITGSGNDTIITGGGDYWNNSINAGAGDNRITVNTAMENGEIYSGDGNDLVSIADDSDNNLISLGGGNNTVNSANGREDVYTGSGDDKVTVAGGYVNVGDGKNEVSITAGDDTSIIAGADDDFIYVADFDETAEQRYNHNINAGGGNNYIYNSNVEHSTINAGSGNDTIITGGGYYYNKNIINAGAGNNKITVNTAMEGGEISAGSGNDSLSIATGSNSNYINVGDGRNVIATGSEFDNNTITLGKGSDFIQVTGENNSIIAGSGKNVILADGKNNTLITGKGNDTISLSSSSNENVVAFGGGSDLVYNYHAGDIVIATKALTKTISGNDVILTDGTSKMTLKGAKSITVNTEKLNSGDEIYKLLASDKTVGDTIMPSGLKVSNTTSKKLITGSILKDTISNSATNVTINALEGNDTISNSGNNVTIDGGAGSNVISLSGNISKGVLVKVSKGFNAIKLGANVSAFKVEGFAANDEIQLATAVSNLKTISGGIAAGAVSIGGISSIATVKTSWKSATDSITYNRATVAGAKLDDTKITYDATSSNKKLFTITGINSSVGVSLKDKVVTLSKSALSGVTGTVSISSGYTLALGSDVTKSTTKAAGWNFSGTTATYKASSTSAGYKLADNKISYVKASGGSTLIKVSGVKSKDGLALKNKVVTVSKAALGTSAVSISSGYTLALGSDVTKSTTKAAGWNFSGTTATYKASSTLAGYKLADNKISYVKASGGSTLIKVSGVKSKDGLALKNKVVTVSKAALGTSAVSISSGYTLALGSDVTKSTTKAAGWNFSGTTATYKASSTLAGYKLADNKISYVKASGGSTLIKVSGVKSKDGLALKNKVVTVSKAALGTSAVSISSGYTLAFGSDVDTTKEAVSKWSTLKSGNVTYLAGGTGSYYSLNKAKTAITYNASVAPATNKIELSGVKGTPTLSGSTVKLTANNFKSNVSIVSNAGGYTLALSGGFKNKTLTGTTGTDKINSSGSNLVISGGKGNDFATLGSSNTFLYAKGDGNDILHNFGNDDKIKLSGTTKAQTSISGKNVILTTDGGKITINGAAQDKVVTIVNSKDEVISAYTYSTDRIINGKSVTLSSAFSGTFNAKDFTKVDGSGVAKAIKIIGGTSASTLTGGAKDDSITSGKANDKLYGNAGKDTLNGGAGNDSLYGGNGNDKLYGGTGNDSLNGGAGDDTLSGGNGNDKLYGGSGKDVFVFSGGKDTITDYTASDDKISVASGLGKETYNVSGKNIILGYGNNSLTVTNGLDKKIMFADDTTKTYTSNGLFNSNKTAVTLPSSTKTFDATKYSNLVTVDGSAANSTVTVKGNAKANYIIAGNKGSSVAGGNGNDKIFGGTGADILYGGDNNDVLLGGNGNDKLYGDANNDSLSGGAGNDSLWGGKGNDTLSGGAGNDNLWGGDGNDTFLYNSGDGNDTIFGFNNSDMLKITDTFSSTYDKSKKEIYFQVGSTSNAITLKDFSATTFNVNGDSYKISGKTLKK